MGCAPVPVRSPAFGVVSSRGSPLCRSSCHTDQYIDTHYLVATLVVLVAGFRCDLQPAPTEATTIMQMTTACHLLRYETAKHVETRKCSEKRETDMSDRSAWWQCYFEAKISFRKQRLPRESHPQRARSLWLRVDGRVVANCLT